MSDIKKKESLDFDNFEDICLVYNDDKKKEVNENNTKRISLFFFLKCFKKDPLIFLVYFFIFLSTLFLMILMIGSCSSIYLSKFEFDDKVRKIIKKDNITFKLYGYCIDSKCSKFSLINNFDKGEKSLN
ncbi:hypothetical protein [endosymbiont GvMRE of Glomus versiforme]|uniref:hypothetical protein n=1 Tax=endosymbiont GvMRE of Glomus versiforme TaxID=2039283 RepID=UPI000EDBF75E|nr:hypothetical protein [endosymbiont GvMRE of Glomus versiforme]RHZ35372.1 hypothetical protein GvMRE_IIg369 [endosymbiont GvMRE of Glomus versiforme]